MGARGPAPKPRAQKILQGTFRKDRDAGAPEPQLALPDPPPALAKIPVALREWKRAAPMLFAQGLMAEDYRDALASYCLLFARSEHAELVLARRAAGAVEEPLDMRSTEQLEGAANKALELMRKFAVEFGMTPASRTRVHAQKPAAGDNPFGAL